MELHINSLYVIIRIIKKTSTAPISSKTIKLSGAPSTGVGQTHSLGVMQSSSTMIRWQGNLGRMSESEKVSFQMVTERNYAISWHNISTEWIPKSRDNNWKARVPVWVLTLGTYLVLSYSDISKLTHSESGMFYSILQR